MTKDAKELIEKWLNEIECLIKKLDVDEKIEPGPNYEILSFKSNIGEIATLKYNNYGYSGRLKRWTLDEMLSDPDIIKIHSVKRLSDGEVFTLGDIIELFGDYPTGSIDKFIIDTFDETKISAYNNCGYGKGISHLKKVKPKEFNKECYAEFKRNLDALNKFHEKTLNKYTTADLISFGNYLLNNKRTYLEQLEKMVNQSDLDNWKK